MLAEWEQALFNADWAPQRAGIIDALVAYCEREQAEHGTPMRTMVRPMLNLANGLPGARSFRRMLSEPQHLRDAKLDLTACVTLRSAVGI